VASDLADSGKTPGTDLREGIPTLPILYALQAEDPGANRLKELMSRGFGADGALDEAIDLLRSHPAMGRARAELAGWSVKARECLDPLPDGAAKSALESLADFVVDRTG
jgi:heptaprenyl diphosphate synthase